MGEYVVKYTCGTCKYYEYAGQYTKGYCNWYKSYYDHTDSCNHWDENESYSGSGGCFLTTACCEYKGLPDNCDELKIMRKFRDSYLQKTRLGRDLIQIYYRNAPAIVERINREDKKVREEIYESIYKEIEKIIETIKDSKNEDAVMAYVKLMLFVNNYIDE